MRTLRAIFNKGVRDGRIPRLAESPFAGVYTGVATTRKLALTHGELALLSAFDPTATAETETNSPQRRLPDGLRRSLAMFLFCYHARGMCFADMAFLKKSDYRSNTIRYRRQKTGQTIEIRVLPAMRRIIDWFALQTAGSKYLFPIIADPLKAPRLQYESGLRLQNQRLKRIADIAGIDSKFSTHVARHSWATVAKNAGLPLAVISEGLGHANQKTTEIYLASLGRSALDYASRVVSEAIIPKRHTTKKSRIDDRLNYGAMLGQQAYGFRYSAELR
jgi:integrase